MAFLKDKDLLDEIKKYLDRTRESNRITANYILSPEPGAVYPFVVITLDTADQEVEQIDYAGDESTEINLEIHCPLDKAHETDGRNTNIERLIYAADSLRGQVFQKQLIDQLRNNLQSSSLRLGGITREYGTVEAGGNRYITATVSIPIITFNTYE